MPGKIKNWINNFLPSPIGPFGKLLIVIMTIQLLFVHFSGVHYFRVVPRDVWRIFHSYILILSGLLLVKYPLEKFKWVSFSMQSLLVVMHCAFIGYFVKTEQSFDFAVVAENFNEIFYSESLFVILNGMDPTAFYIGVFGIGIIFYKTLRKSTIRRFGHFSSKKYAGVFLVYLIFSLSSVIQFDEMTNFFRSAFAYYFQSPQKKYEFNMGKNTFPFLTQNDKQNDYQKEYPNIFLIMVESFNAGFVNTKNEDGKVYTPYFNHLLKDGVYIDRFYGNSVQTVKGHFSTIFSLLPLVQGKVYKEYEHNNFKSLAECLKDAGYSTYFFNGHNSTGFDNTRSMMKTHGYDTYLVGKELLDESFKDSWGSWGLSDDELYRKVFNHLDQIRLEKSPSFVTITPSFHHVPFSIPKDKRELVENPISIRSRYSNSIRLADNGFRVFFEELKKRPEFKNSLVVITADHAFPVGDHGIYFNEVGYFEESFRIPCLIYWDGHIHPKLDNENVFSQIDIAPTILSAINAMPSFHHFQGQNMLNETIEKKPVYLIQPYNGTILSVVDFPIKYVKRFRTGEEWIFNLNVDPLEQTNILNQFNNNRMDKLRKSLEYIFLNQYLIENNKVFPASAG
jgi:phosphoglycerol transferase MdoB-like AlkP superfamily enzyme